ncbi:hypothetical protein [Stenotrophomonas pigmentata]|uniref:hypothetical protein n=1 Tax=Stenotrophomonas pigmentata TaxID=3055080 RepID=UPI0026EAB5A1|nr:hypothetical protein [Stenotrophomonas sp. 610A2]
MRFWQRSAISILALLALLIAAPGLFYVIGLSKVHGRPTPADPALFSRNEIAAAWAQCHEKIPIAAAATNPWSVAGNLLFGSPDHAPPGERASWRIAGAHNAASHLQSNTAWHISGSALTIWITRHWSADQIGATIARDRLCK